MAQKIENNDDEAAKWLNLAIFSSVSFFVLVSIWLWASTAESVVVSAIISGLASCL